MSFAVFLAGLAAQMSVVEAASVQAALDRGTLLYWYDQAAWHGTDDLRERHGDRLSDLGGWIVDGPPSAPTLVFYDKNEAEPRAVYVAEFKAGKLTSSRLMGDEEDRRLSPERKRMVAALAKARDTLAKSDAVNCSNRPFNTIVVPAFAPAEPTTVYFLTPQTSHESLPFGGHYSVEVAADGTVGTLRRFTKGCLELPLNGDKGQPEGVVVTHLLDSTPTELHVFSMFAARKPIYVITSSNERIWATEASGGQARIRLLDQKP